LELAAISAVLALSACRTVPIPPPEEIRVPPGLSLENVRSSIVLALGPNEDATSTINVRPRFLGGFSGSVASGPSAPEWYPRGEQPGVIFATYRSRNRNVLNVEIRYSENLIQVEITDSERLRHGNGRIHKIVRVWLPELYDRLRVSLGRTAVRP